MLATLVGVRSLVTGLAILGALGAVGPAQAQTRLYILFPGSAVFCPFGCSPSVLLDVSVDERRILRQTAVLNAREWVAGPVVTADGGVVSWLGTERLRTRSYLSTFEVATGNQAVVLDVATPWSSGSLHADPRALRLYGQLGGFPNGPIAILEPHGIRTLPDPCPGVGLVGMSGNAARLLGVCSGPVFSNQWRVLVVDPHTGAPLSNTLTPTGRVALDYEGNVFFIAWSDVARAEAGVTSYDAATGQPLASRAVHPNSYVGRAFVHDSRAGRLYVTLRARQGQGVAIHALAAQSLETIGQIPAPYPDAEAGVIADPDTPLVYVLWYSQSSVTRRTRLSVYEAIGFTPVAEADLDLYSDEPQMVLAPRLDLIRFGGHLPKGGYDVPNGGNEKPTPPSAIHG